MKLRQLLNEDAPSVVLTKMATTIDPTVSRLNGYTNNSCFGRVAHYLKQHWNDTWYILLFGLREPNEVTHCCLYDANGKPVVDTFDGTPKNVNGDIMYVDAHGNNHELLDSMSVGTFKQRYLTQ